MIYSIRSLVSCLGRLIEIKRLVIILLASGLLTPSLASVASAGQSNTIWSANFETGDHSQFNQCSVQPGGANPPAVATNIVHTGTYSEYDYYDGDGGTGLPHRSYCGEAFNVANQYTSIENDVWIYVPSSVNGTVQDYETWFTFVNLFFARSDGSSKGALVVMGCTSGGGYPCDHRQLSLNTGPFSSGHVIIASNNVTWPFDQWFALRTLITQSNGITMITLYEVLNGNQQLVMKVSSTTANLYFYQAHWAGARLMIRMSSL